MACDPARYSLAHGGKDGHPFPVPLRVYDETIRVLKQAVDQAKLGREEKLSAIARLDAQARALQASASGPSFEAFIASERASSHRLGGRSVFGWAAPVTPPEGASGGRAAHPRRTAAHAQPAAAHAQPAAAHSRPGAAGPQLPATGLVPAAGQRRGSSRVLGAEAGEQLQLPGLRRRRS